MAETQILLNGFSIIGNPQTNSNNKAGGNLMVHDGEAVFDDDDIVVFTVTNVTDDGAVTEDSVVTSIIVYENATDYFYDEPKYTYSGSAELELGRNSTGDRYLEFDSSGLMSTETDAPVLDELAVVAGVNILGTLASGTGPFVVPTNEDIDFDGDGTISPDEEGDGVFSSDLNDLAVVCFARGTLIETPDGPRFVETLRPGDLVNTLDEGPQPIRWAGLQRTVGHGALAPVLFAAGAIGNLRPLRVSQNHRMLVTGPQAELLFGQSQVLVAAKHMVNGTTIRRQPCAQIDYVHFLFDDHQIVFAEGCPSESLYPGAQTLDVLAEDGRDEILALFPDLALSTEPRPLSRYALSGVEASALAS